MAVDRQLALEPDVIDYLVHRMDRSYVSAGALIAALDQLSLIRKRRRITLPMAREAMIGSNAPSDLKDD